MRLFLRLLAALCAVLFFSLPAMASGHSYAPDPIDPLGRTVLLPATTHGQKGILLNAQDDILALSREHLNDTEALTVRQFIRNQRRACFPVAWAPALATPDASPFHACGHSLAAGLHYLFQRLVREHRTLEVAQLEKLFHQPAAFAVCSQSAQRFTTADLVVTLRFEWLLGSFGIAIMGTFAAAAWHRRRLRPQTPTWRPLRA